MTIKGITQITIVLTVLTGAFAATGTGYASWSDTLQIGETVDTGIVNLEYTGAFTNDDGVPTGGAVDQDDDNMMCQSFDAYGPSSSADPLEDGPSPSSDSGSTSRYGLDVARCVATHEVGTLLATLSTENGYPGYHCTAWFDVTNNGLLLAKLTAVYAESAQGTYSLTDGLSLDVVSGISIAVEGLTLCQSIEPGETVRLTVHQQVLAAAPPSASLHYSGKVNFQQWTGLGDSDDEACGPDDGP